MAEQMQRPKRIWGLDLAGLGGSNNTGLAMIEVDGITDSCMPATVFRNHPFNRKIVSATRWDDDRIDELVACLRSWSNAENHLYVDIPIKWQCLPRVPDPLFVWQSKKRVVDFVFGGLAPFAERIGSQTADFRVLSQRAGIASHVGETLFEAYPKATLRKILGQKYPEAAKAADTYLQRLMERLNLSVVRGESDDPLNHDEVDAVVCALAGAREFESLTEETLILEWSGPSAKRTNYEEIRARRPDFFHPPAGYRVVPPLGINWCKNRIEVTIMDWSRWAARNG